MRTSNGIDLVKNMKTNQNQKLTYQLDDGMVTVLVLVLSR